MTNHDPRPGATPASFSYFDMQAFMGATKHMGGFQSTQELIRLLEIRQDDTVLDVGCGAGATAVYLASEVGCRVTAVDLRDSMIELTRQRAERERLLERIQLRQADARQLPFEDGSFDALVCESVLTFVDDKQKAIDEFARLVKAGGRIGLNEQFWARPPTPEMLEYVRRTWEFSDLPTVDQWLGMLQTAGLEQVQAIEFKIDARRESSQVSRYSPGDIWRMFSRILGLYLKNPQFRAYMRERSKMPKGIFERLVYGVFVGRKPAIRIPVD
ncbi:MAG: methyltransferase domain-containing protein [Anaerolineales bacterium]|nr:methyltransferase domain-containing protein [Anaerolineales bacterium]